MLARFGACNMHQNQHVKVWIGQQDAEKVSSNKKKQLDEHFAFG